VELLVTKKDTIDMMSSIAIDTNVSIVNVVGLCIEYNQENTIFHEGHRFLLQQASENCDVLCCGLTYPSLKIPDSIVNVTEKYPHSTEIIYDKIKDQVLKLTDGINVDYLSFLDLNKDDFELLIYRVADEDFMNLFKNASDLTKRSMMFWEILRRWSEYYKSLMDSEKGVFIRGKPDLVNVTLQAIWTDISINSKKALPTKSVKRFIAPLYRDNDDLLPSRCLNESAECRNFRVLVRDYIKNTKFNIGDKILDIKSEISSLITSSDFNLDIRSCDMETLKESDIITNKNVINIGIYDILSNYFFKDIILIGFDESKWYDPYTRLDL